MSRFENNGTETGDIHTVQVVEVAVFMTEKIAVRRK